MDRSDEPARVRPWTVYVLVAFGVIGLVWKVVTVSFSLWDFVYLPLNLWIAYSLWTGKQWAFTLSFMFASLCAFFLVVATLIQVLLFDMSIHRGVLWGFMATVIWLALLLHPQTKRFAGLDTPPAVRKEPSSA
jgi:hypothetical protein